jgi:ATP-binding cassette subfamily F protein uup
VGKSTFLRVVAQQLNLTAGSVSLGDTVQVGYYSQTGLEFSKEQADMSVFEFIASAVEKAAPAENHKSEMPKIVISETEVRSRRKRLAGKTTTISTSIVENTGVKTSTAFSENEIRKWLHRFQFPVQKWQNRVGTLSGGEKRRLQLLQVIAKKPNVLLLDEPTNDLDLSTISALEEYLLEQFQGVVVLASHDVAFLDKIAEHLFLMPHSIHSSGSEAEGSGNRIMDFLGSYEEYIAVYSTEPTDNKKKGGKNSKSDSSSRISSAASNAVSASCVAASNSSGSSAISNLSYNERKEFGRLEKEIAKISAQVADLDALLSSFYSLEPSAGHDQNWGTKKSEELAKMRAELIAKEARWMQLATK